VTLGGADWCVLAILLAINRGENSLLGLWGVEGCRGPFDSAQGRLFTAPRDSARLCSG